MNRHLHNVGRVAAAAVTRTCAVLSNLRTAIREARQLEAELLLERYPFIDS